MKKFHAYRAKLNLPESHFNSFSNSVTMIKSGSALSLQLSVSQMAEDMMEPYIKQGLKFSV